MALNVDEEARVGPGGSDVEQWRPRAVAVVGAGLMGAGIAQCAAEAGYRVALYDAYPEGLARGVDQIRDSLARRQRAGGIDELPAEVLTRISGVEELPEAVRAVDLVIEAVPEDLDVKREVLAAVDSAAPADAVLATNTSQFSITQLATFVTGPERVVGLHFMNPPPLMGMVEVLTGLDTSPVVLDRALSFVRGLGKVPTLARDVTGYVASRGGIVLQLEAMRILGEQIAAAEDIDTTFRLGWGHSMGPLEVSDFVGLDTLLMVAENLMEAHGERFRPPPLLRQLVAAGHFGRKSGRGIYQYPRPAKGTP